MGLSKIIFYLLQDGCSYKAPKYRSRAASHLAIWSRSDGN